MGGCSCCPFFSFFSKSSPPFCRADCVLPLPAMSCFGTTFFDQRMRQSGTYQVKLSREGLEAWGIQTLHAEGQDDLVIASINRNGTPVGKWNQKSDDPVVHDRPILNVNGHSSIQDMLDELRYARTLKMEISLRLSREHHILLRQHRRSEELRVRVAKVEAMLQEAPQMEGVADACPVCLDDMASQGSVNRLPCGHCFHRSCISKWLVKAFSPTCPSCKKQLEIPGMDEGEYQDVEGSDIQVMNF